MVKVLSENKIAGQISDHYCNTKRLITALQNQHQYQTGGSICKKAGYIINTKAVLGTQFF